jgi:CDP-diacylglycerol--glycerol-3-phosphate 3-phosphatidyltransferase
MREQGSLLRLVARNIPNAISATRLAATSVLLAAVLLHHIHLFTWLLLACLLSDILDGLIARTFHLTSRIGAALDSAADAATMLIGIAGVFVFQRPFVAAHVALISIVVFLYAAEIVTSLIRYGRLSSFHTLLTRVAAYAAGIFVMSLFLWGYHFWLFYLAAATYLLSLVEQLILISMLPTWQCDVGGLHRVLSARKAKP